MLNFSDVKTLIASIRTSTPQVFEGNVKVNAENFMYDGFNAEAIIQEIMNCQSTISVDQKKQDLVDLVLVGLIRGNIRTDQIGKTNDAGKARINELITRYKVLTRATKSSKVALTMNSVTFTRCISVFPSIASILINYNAFKPEENLCNFGSDQLPKELRHPGAASLIPTGYFGNIILKAHIAFMIAFGKRINPKDTRPILEMYEAQKSFSLAAVTSNKIFTQDDRVSFLKQLGLDTKACAKIYIKIANKLMLALDKDLFAEEAVLRSCLKADILDFSIEIV